MRVVARKRLYADYSQMSGPSDRTEHHEIDMEPRGVPEAALHTPRGGTLACDCLHRSAVHNNQIALRSPSGIQGRRSVHLKYVCRDVGRTLLTTDGYNLARGYSCILVPRLRLLDIIP